MQNQLLFRAAQRAKFWRCTLAQGRIFPNSIQNLPAPRENFREICLCDVDSILKIKICEKSACLCTNSHK